MFVYQVIAWLLIFNMDSATCSNSTEINGTSVSEYPSTHAASQTSIPLSTVSSLNSSNSDDVSHQITSTLQSEPLPSTDESQLSSMMPGATDEIINSVNPTLVTTLSEQTSVGNTILEPTLNVVLSDGTLVKSVSTLSESSSESVTLPSSLIESPTHFVELSSTLVEPSSNLVESSSASVGPLSTLVAPSSTLVEQSSTSVGPLSALVEPSSTVIEPSQQIVEPSSTSVGPFSTLVEPSSTLVEQSSTSVGPLSALVEPSSTVIEPSEQIVEKSSTLVEPTQSPAESLSTLFTPPSTVAESSTHLVEVPVSDSGITISNNFTDLSVSASSLHSDELLTVSEFSYISLADLLSTSMQPSSDYTYSFLPLTHIDNTISYSSFGYTTSLETMISSESITETNTAFDSASISSPLSETVTATITNITEESLGPSTLSGYETETSLFPIPNSSLGYSQTLSPASAAETITVSTNTLQFTESITSPYTTTVIKTTEPGVVTSTTTLPTASATPTTKTASLSSVIASTTPRGTELSTPAQNLPIKSSSGLSTGGKVAIGIIIPLAVIGLIILGVFFYRRYNWTRGSFKNFLQPGVHYRAYTNETFTDDDVTLGGSWRKVPDS